MERRHLTRFAWLSAAAAVLTIVLKTAAYLLTGSVGLLSDAMESIVNVVAALFALGAIAFAAFFIVLLRRMQGQPAAPARPAV